MKNYITIKNLIKFLSIILFAITVNSCQRDMDAEEDDIPQEEITNIILNVKDIEAGTTKSYNYIIGSESPTIILTNGKTYDVEAIFKNGYEDVTEEIKEAKDEHFLIFDFPKSDIHLTREDDEESTGKLGKVGLKTKWTVNNVSDSSTGLLILSVIHDPISASEEKSGTSWGSAKGGETDSEARYFLSH